MVEPRYRAVPIEQRRSVALDELTLVYHRASGITHLLGSPAPEILAELADEPLTVAALHARLAATFDLADGDAAALRARLDELVAAGLVLQA